ncbi:MAG: hypothetical protein Q8K99_09055 [Actinomycetota bacterium]|nr:hypothetical protein [Actinomycetota bacterium]
MFGIGPMELLILVTIIALVFGPGAVVLWILTRAKDAAAPPAPPMHDNALDIARERYARGEIDAEQLAEITRTLGYDDDAESPDEGPVSSS